MFRPPVVAIFREVFFEGCVTKNVKMWYSWIRASQYKLVEITKRCNLVIEFVIPKFIEGSTCLSGIPLNIRSSKLYLQPVVYIPMW